VSKTGERCTNKAKPNGLCGKHGGYTIDAAADAPDAVSIYAQHYDDHDIAFLTGTQVGSVDAEIQLCRVRINRALKAEKKNRMKLVEKRETKGGQDSGQVVRTYKQPDYDLVIDRLMGRLGTLEKLRRELNGDGTTPLEVAQDVAAAMKAIAAQGG
jgi:hypothetical protein